jgi:anti-sigma-K factor RskA
MNDDVHTMVGAYALDALTAEEQARFEDHLHTCAPCREELVELQATSARLGVAVAAPPPPVVRERVMDAITRIPQERPRPTVVPISRARRWAPGLLAAAAVLAVLASLGAFVVERGRTQDVRQEQAAMSAVLAAPDAQVQSLTLDGGARLRVVSSPSLERAVVASAEMPEAGAGKDYEVWAIGADGPVSAGIMEPGDDGSAKAQLIDDLAHATALAITVEPEGGSPDGRPSSDPIVTVDLA